jgi:hypothetical protein
MLGRLMQGYGRGGQLESSTEENHTRDLLWPESYTESRIGSLSPPTTPFGSPNARVSPFDDRGGLDLDESSHLRLIIAQDAFSTNERPLVLFDTQPREPKPSPVTQKTPTSPVVPSNRFEGSSPTLGHARNRSSTLSGSSNTWGRPSKETESVDHIGAILDCMFGVSSATKSGSSTKLHFLPGDKSPASEMSPHVTARTGFPPSRAPLQRARTSMNTGTGLHQSGIKAATPDARDAVLVTLVFPVAVYEDQKQPNVLRRSSTAEADVGSPSSNAPDIDGNTFMHEKKAKPKENRTPSFAIGLLFYLPRPGDLRPSTSSGRPLSRASSNASSTPQSFGSMSSSWTFLNAIPEHLWIDDVTNYMADQGLSIIMRNWDVIIRSLSVVEAVARSKLGELLQEVLAAMIVSAEKMPKGPYEQRINQRKVFLRVPNRLASIQNLQREARYALWRISYALRVPRVLTGLGLDSGGHWLDEARYLVRLCGNKQQNFFLFNLLTAFLGNHTQWMERLGPDWYRKQFKALNKAKAGNNDLASRTVIVSDSRSLARRIIFLLASFLPRSAMPRRFDEHGSPLLTPNIGSSSPVKRGGGVDSLRRHAHNKSREGTLTFKRRAVPGLSTSFSSSESIGGIAKAMQGNVSSRPAANNNKSSSNGAQLPIFSPTDSATQLQKTDATSSTVTPDLGTPVPHFTSNRDSYFPDSAIVDGDESNASADLARILRRDSSAQSRSRPPSINWGSLVNNVSGLWGRRQDSISTSNDVSVPSMSGGLSDRRKHAPRAVPIHALRPSQLESMVNEAAQMRHGDKENGLDAISPVPKQSSLPRKIRPPQLTVDEKDGVVDVDIDLPGFVPWDGDRSLHKPHSRSLASTEDDDSSFSSLSIGHSTLGSPSPNVAGYLKKYHEDFVLQGVKPYPSLQEEVKQSMSREGTTTSMPSASLANDQPAAEQWISRSTTLVADLRTYTIHRLTLQQRARGSIQSTTSATDSDNKASPPAGREHFERFQDELVMDFDTTLTDAIERVLHDTEPMKQKSATTSKTHSRAVSTGTASSKQSLPVEITSSAQARQWRQPATLSQSDCRQAVVGALEEVVKSVNDEVAKLPRDRNGGGHVRISETTLDKDAKHNNVLREGVKQWLLNVETRSVW